MKKAIITGSSKGLGLAIAKRFALEGYDVAIGSRSEKSLEKAEKEIGNSTGKVIAEAVDFSDEKSIQNYFSAVLQTMGSVDILVNNMGLYLNDRADEAIEDQLLSCLNSNLFSAVRSTNQVLEQMKKQQSGIIINIVSIAAKDMRLDAASYTISKVALSAYTDLLRKEVKKYGIRVVGIYPGAMDTASWEGIDVDHSKLISMKEMTDAVMNIVSTGGNSVIEELVINNLKDL